MIPDRKSISERPAEANGTRFGDFEMDTVIGAKQTEMMVTITEGKTNLVLIQKLPEGWNVKEVSKTVTAMLLPYMDKLNTHPLK